MRKVLTDKNFLSTVEKLFFVSVGSVMFCFMLWKAPDQAQNIINMAGLLFVGAKIKEKIGF